MRLRALVALLVLLAAGCADDPTVLGEGERSSSGWERLTDAPLSGRTSASVVGVGSEVYVFGGWEALCPPGADCSGPTEPPFADGAVLDLPAQQWRRIADAPFGFVHGSAAVLDGDIYVVANCVGSVKACYDGSELLRYDTVGDAWTDLGEMPKGVGTQLVATDHGLVALAGSEERGRPRDAVYDPASSAWTVIPDDPLPRSYDRFGVADGERLLLFGSPMVESDQESQHKLAAAYEWTSRTWSELPSAPAAGYQAWQAGDRVFLNPHFGSDGGGILDLASDTWDPIPVEGSGWDGDAAGTVSADGATYEYSAGWVFDARDDSWFEIPDRGGDAYDESVAAVGQSLVVFGGQRWSDEGGDPDGELLAETWVYEPPR